MNISEVIIYGMKMNLLFYLILLPKIMAMMEFQVIYMKIVLEMDNGKREKKYIN